MLNVVHGKHAMVNRICDSKDIQAVAFVGSDAGGSHVYSRACKAGKRVQSNMGAKNHAVVLPDADMGLAVSALTGAAFGAAGQRCMAISAAVLVGDATALEQGLVDAASKLKVLLLVNCESRRGDHVVCMRVAGIGGRRWVEAMRP